MTIYTSHLSCSNYAEFTGSVELSASLTVKGFGGMDVYGNPKVIEGNATVSPNHYVILYAPVTIGAAGVVTIQSGSVVKLITFDDVKF